MAPLPLEIAVKALQRLKKEKESYIKELKEQEIELETLKNRNADEILLKKHTEVCEETKRMLPELDSQIKLHTERLLSLLKTYPNDEYAQEANVVLQ